MRSWLRRRGIRTLGPYIQTTADAGALRGSRAQVPSTARPPVATVVSLALLLAACQTPATKTVIQVEKVPVAVQPIKATDVPVPPAPLPKRPDSLSDAADLLLSQVCSLEEYVLKADPLLRVSAGLPPKLLGSYPECEH